MLRKMMIFGVRVTGIRSTRSCLSSLENRGFVSKVRPTVSTDGREGAEAEARGVGFPLEVSMKKE